MTPELASMELSQPGGSNSAGDLIRRFGGLPHPEGDFRGFEGVVPYFGVQVTPYGYVTGHDRSHLLIRLSQEQRRSNCFEINIAFTSFPGGLAPMLCYDSGQGFNEAQRIPMALAGSGRYTASFTLDKPIRQLRLDPGVGPAVFTIHHLTIKADPYETILQESAAQRHPPDVICFPVIDWEYRYQRPQHLASGLAKRGHRVFYGSTVLQGLSSLETQERFLAPGVLGFALPGNNRLSIYKNLVTDNTVERQLFAMEEFAKRHRIYEAILMVQLPFWNRLARRLRGEFGWKIVYDCMDDHTGFADNSPAIMVQERELLAEADLLITSSAVLHEKVACEHPRALLLRNGGDVDHFSSAITGADKQSGGSVIIGYYGAIAEWFDVAAVYNAAINRPHWKFVLIGAVHNLNIECLRGCPNVSFVGEVPYPELPRHLASFSVCTIPFQRIPLTEATNPVKLYEYFASGKPVVGRNLPEICFFDDVVDIYDTPDEYLAALDRAVGEVSYDKALRRQELAYANRWDARVDALEEQLVTLHQKVAIVIISYQRVDILHECVQSILEHTRYPNYEIVIVDNASGEGVQHYLDLLERTSSKVRIVRNRANRGFAAANNQGIAEATDADVFVLLNNDTIVTPGWLTRLVWYTQQSDIGIVGPVTNCIGNEAQVLVPYTQPLVDKQTMLAFARHFTNYHRREHFDIGVLAMFCVAFRREVVERVGLLDERFGMGMFEDDDYAQRVRQAGLRVVCAEDVFVHHVGSASFKKLNPTAYAELFEKNKAIYEEKWGRWVPHVYR